MNGESEGDVHVSSCIVASCTGEKSTLHIGEMNRGIEKANAVHEICLESYI